jgi:predicted methyltransferase
MKYSIALILVLSATASHAEIDWSSVLQGEHRAAENSARDIYRHPKQTLEFFGLTENMTVVELSPGSSGWYTEVLAPVLKGEGRLVAAHSALNPPHPYYRRSLGKYLTKLGENNDIFGAVEIRQWQPPLILDNVDGASADMVLTFRNVHNWMEAGTADAILQASFAALKSGGVFGVVEHRAKPGTSMEDMIESGYVTEQKVIELVEAAGFKLQKKSEINANPKDTAQHPKGVWTLPPALRLGDVKREHYLAIGESDRMTLKFRKP